MAFNLGKKFNQPQKTWALWLLIILISIFALRTFNQPVSSIAEISYSEFLDAIRNNHISSLSIQGNEFQGVYSTGGGKFKTVGPVSEHILKTLDESNVIVKFKLEEKSSFWNTLLFSWGPLIVIFAIFLFTMRQIQAGGGKAMNFGRSKAKLVEDNQKKVTFADVAGVDEAKEELNEIISFLKEPKRFTVLGGRIPKGVLLMGSPGSGKTLIARAVAGEANVPFYSMSGSDFVELFVGVGASRVRDLFEKGKKNAPCIIFIDEIDAVGRQRGAGLGGGHDEREQTLNQLLVEMDGFESNDGVIIMAATNRPDVLDPALLRPGRFDRRVVVPTPDVGGREAILNVHSRNKPMADDADLSKIARGTPGFSGADLENIVNEAALIAAKASKKVIEMCDFDLAKDKVMMGSERKSMIISDDEKKITAYHEAGHALVAMSLPGADPIHKVTIIPRGRALGLTQQLPTDDRYTQNKKFCKINIATLMGGRAAEILIFDDPTTGAGNDIERATELARRMVCEWGMSKKMGPLAFGKNDEQIFLGREISKQTNYSENTANDIDVEVKSLVTAGYEQALQLLTEKNDQLEILAQGLLKYESLSLEQIEALFRGEELIIPKTDCSKSTQKEDDTILPEAEDLSDVTISTDAVGRA